MKDKKPRNPIRPEKLRTSYERTASDIHVVLRHRAWSTGLFLLFFLIFWTAGCVFIAFHVMQDPKLINILFGSVFWIGWIFAFLFMVTSLIGCDELRVNQEELVYSYWLIVRLSQRRVPVDEVKSISITEGMPSTDSTNAQPGIEIQTFGKPIKLFVGVPRPELDWLIAELVDVTGLARRVQASDAATDIRAGGFEQSLSIVEPPSDCAWQMRHEFDGIEFYQRGQFSIVGLFGALFIAAFWNGIISVFVLNLLGFGDDKPRGLEWVMQAVFLIPFVLVGLLFVFLVILTIIEPLRITRWRFYTNSIECQWAWFGLGPRWRYEVVRLGRITVKKMERKIRAQKDSEGNTADDGLRYCVSFVNPNDTELCQFGSLTEGEAIWIAETVRPILPLAS